MGDLAYWAVVDFLRGILSLVCRIEVSGTREVPAGPWILASNHLSHFDPPLLASAFARPIDFLAMRELFQPAWFGFLMEKCHVIPISRERVDTKAFKIALLRLKAGRIVGIFPEGGLRAGKTSVLEGAELTEGFSLLAMRSGCGPAGGAGGKRSALCGKKLVPSTPSGGGGGRADSCAAGQGESEGVGGEVG